MGKKILMGKKIFYDGRNVGELFDVFVKRVNSSKHYFVKFRGYGISKSVLEFLRDKNVSHIMIIEESKTEQRTFVSSIDQWFTANDWADKSSGTVDNQKVLELSKMKQI